MKMLIKQNFQRIAQMWRTEHQSHGDYSLETLRKQFCRCVARDLQNQGKKLALSQIPSWVLLIGSLTGWSLVNSSPLKAQITSDGTAGTEVNTVNHVTEISGGTKANSNLFHSFQDFSVATGSTASFNNSSDISNIVGRVTGGNISNIDGLIRANGNANLILINPGGINFGANASLDIGGSFLGSTAESVIFEDGTVFSAANTPVEPVLTISVPVGLQLGQNSGGIQVTGTENIGSDFEAHPSLAVTPGNTLALVGNDVTFNRGVVTAESGRIELGSVAAGEVSITDINVGWQLGYEAVTQLADISLLTESSVENPNSIHNSDGGIQVQGSNITLERSQITAPTLGDSPGADITIRASESLSLQGEKKDGVISGSQILNEVSTEASGQGGVINIETDSLSISDRSFISNTTFGAGDGGEINILASNINMTGMGFEEFQQNFQTGVLNGTLQQTSGTGIFIGTLATGKSGNLNIDTDSLSLNEGAIFFSSLLTAGTGGDINVNATDIEISASALQGGGGSNSIGTALSGDFNLETQRLIVTDGGTIANGTAGDAAGGDIRISAAEFIELKDSPVDSIILTGIYTNTFLGSGTGGDIDINTNNLTIDDAVIVSDTGGLLADGTTITEGGLGGNINIQAARGIEARGLPANPALISGISTTTFSSSDAGNLSILTDKLIIRDGAEFSSATLGDGNGGQLSIKATDSIEVIGVSTDRGINRGGLLASSGRIEYPNLVSIGSSGNISIETPELNVTNGANIDVQSLSLGNAGHIEINTNSISLDRQSSISAATQLDVGGDISLSAENIFLRRNSTITATAAGREGGGNITIDADNLVILEDSQIVADSFMGVGGNIEINTQGLFVCRECQISASSRLGIDGGVNIENLEPDPQLEEVGDLPQQPTQAQETIAIACPLERKTNSSVLTITGRGGLPPRPQESLSGESLVKFNNAVPPAESINSTPPKHSTLPPPARGWYLNPQGIVVLSAQPSGIKTNNKTPTNLDCHVN